MRNAALIIIVLASLALVPVMPYGFYPVVRWPLCIAAAYLAFQHHGKSTTAWMWIWAVVAGVYNPLFPVHSTRAIWSIVNIATIVLAAVQLAASRTARSAN